MSDIEKQSIKWLAEVIELRYGSADDEDGPLKIVSMEDGLHAVMYELTRVRVRLDRAGYIRTQASLKKSSLVRSKKSTDFAAETAFAEAASVRDRNKKEFESALAIKSNSLLDSFEEKRAAFEAQRAVDVVSDAYFNIDQMIKEMDKIRDDLKTIIRALQFASSLEH